MLADLGLLKMLAAFLVMFLAAIVQGTVGMGMGVLATPLLILIEPRLVPGPFILSAFSVVFPMVYREWESIDISKLKPALLGYIPGSLVAAAGLNWIPRSELSLLFGIMILLALVMSVVGWRIKFTSSRVFSVGMISGLMGTIAGMSGPAMAILLQDEEGPRLRGMLAGFFVTAGLISVGVLIWIGFIGWEEAKLALLLMPAPVLGFLLSSYFTPYLDRGYTRPAVLVISFFTVILVFARYLI
jgi:uncharacterized membrane protein YfcA